MDVYEEIGALAGGLLQRTFFVCTSEPLAPPEQILPHIPDHLRQLVVMEKRGDLLASGPFLEEGAVSMRAMFIIRAKDRFDAELIANEDPLHKLGLRRYSLEEWQLNQGRVSVQIDFSDRQGALDGV